jgi:hypothetical protein
MNGQKARAFRRQDANRATPQDRVIIARAYAAAIERSKIKPKFKVQRKRTPGAYTTPSWPWTVDQGKQSRPVIVMRPIRALSARLMSEVIPDADGVRKVPARYVEIIRSMLNAPKHIIDAAALSY